MEHGAELTAHITTGAAIVYAIQWTKQSGLIPWLTVDTKILNRVLSAVLAALAAAGITWTYSGGEGTLIITGLTGPALVAGFWEWFKQFTMQQLIFDGVVQKSGSTP